MSGITVDTVAPSSISAVAAASYSISFSALPPTGDAVFLSMSSVGNGSMAISTVTDNQTGNTFVKVTSEQDGAQGRVELWWCPAITAASGTYTLTATVNSSANYQCADLAMIAVSGLAGTIDKTGIHTSGASTSATVTASGANSAPNELVIAAAIMGTFTTTAGLTTPPNSGYTAWLIDQGASNGQTGTGFGYKIVSAIETSSASWAWTPSSNNSEIVASFQGSAQPPLVTTPPGGSTCAPGGTNAFSVSATSPGGSTLTFQWQSAPITSLYANVPGTFTNISGATSSSYTTPTQGAADNGTWYRCVLTNTPGSTTTAAARGWVTGAPSGGKGRFFTSWFKQARQRRGHVVSLLEKSTQSPGPAQVGLTIWRNWFFGPIIGVGAATEAADVASGAGTASSGVSGTGAAVEGADVVAASGAATDSGSGASSEAADVLAGSGTVTDPGSAAITEAHDTVSASGSTSDAGSGAPTEASDTVAASGSTSDAGSAAIVEPSDTVAGSGAVAGSDTGSGAIAEPADVVNASGATSDAGSAAIVEPADVVSGSGTAGDAGSAAALEAADVINASGATSDTGSGAATEASDQVNASGSTSDSGSGSAAESPDTVSGAGSVGGGGSGAIVEPADVVAASGSTSDSGSAAISEPADSITATGSTSDSGAGAATEGLDTVAAAGTAGPGGIGGAVEASDVVSAAGATKESGSGAANESADSIAAAGSATDSGSAAASESSDVVSGTGTARPPGFSQPLGDFIPFIDVDDRRIVLAASSDRRITLLFDAEARLSFDEPDDRRIALDSMNERLIPTAPDDRRITIGAP